MSIRIHTTIVAAVVVAAVAVPSAAMAAGNGSHVVPNSSINYREPGSTGYVAQPRFSLPYTEPGSTGYVPQRFTIRYSEPGSTGWLPPAAAAAGTSGGFDWTSALIGVVAGVGLALAGAGALKRRRVLAAV
jgi:hypothetical protein